MFKFILGFILLGLATFFFVGRFRKNVEAFTKQKSRELDKQRKKVSKQIRKRTAQARH